MLALTSKLSSRYKGKNAPHGELAVGEQNSGGCVYTTSQHLIKGPCSFPLCRGPSCRDRHLHSTAGFSSLSVSSHRVTETDRVMSWALPHLLLCLSWENSISMSFKTHWHVTNSTVQSPIQVFLWFPDSRNNCATWRSNTETFQTTLHVLLAMAFAFEMLYFSKAKIIQYSLKEIKNCLTILP